MMRCSVCGGKIEENSMFCRFCGKKIIKKNVKLSKPPRFIITLAISLIILAISMWGVVIYAMLTPSGYLVVDDRNVLNIYPRCVDSRTDIVSNNECKDKESNYEITDSSIKSNCVESKEECLKYLAGLCVKKRIKCVRKLVVCGINMNNNGLESGTWKIKLNLLSDQVLDSKIRTITLNPHSSSKNMPRYYEDEFCGMKLTNHEENMLKMSFEGVGIVTGFDLTEDLDKQLSCDFEILGSTC